jgi:PAS domain S-box-containing protein
MTHSAIFIFGDDLSFIFSNRSMERLTGYAQEELQAMKVTDIFPAELHSSFLSMKRSPSAEEGIPQQAEFEILRKDGTRRWIDLTWGEVLFQEVRATIATAFDITERKLAELRIRALASELSATEQRSRRRMAAFLHDKIGHALALSKMKVETLLESHDRETMRQSVEEVHALLREAIQTTRSFTFELSPPILYDLGLVPAIDWLVEELRKREMINATLRKPPFKIQLADEVRNVLFEGTRELLINAMKHGRATCIDVAVDLQGPVMILTVRDDGVGCDLASMDRLQRGGKGFGLYNLRERLKDVGGRMEIESQPNRGTTVRMVAPVLQ